MRWRARNRRGFLASSFASDGVPTARERNLRGVPSQSQARSAPERLRRPCPGAYPTRDGTVETRAHSAQTSWCARCARTCTITGGSLYIAVVCVGRWETRRVTNKRHQAVPHRRRTGP
jgi:hypothetical protein